MRNPVCPLCADVPAGDASVVSGRRFLQCDRCALIFVHPVDRLLPLQETLRYLAHQNTAADAGYVAHLRRLVDPLIDAVPAGARGLDFGCGPSPVLAELLHATGRPTDSYDPLFYPDDALLRDRYHFVACSEVVEHAHDPSALFDQLSSLLRPGGTLGVMTAFHAGIESLTGWWYQRDATHVSFFTERTMRWIAARAGWSVTLPSPGVTLFTSPGYCTVP